MKKQKKKNPASSALCTLQWFGSELLFRYHPIILTDVSVSRIYTLLFPRSNSIKHILVSKKAHCKLMRSLKEKKKKPQNKINRQWLSHLGFPNILFRVKEIHFHITKSSRNQHILGSPYPLLGGGGLIDCIKDQIFLDNCWHLA